MAYEGGRSMDTPKKNRPNSKKKIAARKEARKASGMSAQKFYVKTRIAEAAKSGKTVTAKNLRKKFQSGDVSRKGFGAPKKKTGATTTVTKTPYDAKGSAKNPEMRTNNLYGKSSAKTPNRGIKPFPKPQRPSRAMAATSKTYGSSGGNPLVAGLRKIYSGNPRNINIQNQGPGTSAYKKKYGNSGRNKQGGLIKGAPKY